MSGLLSELFSNIATVRSFGGEAAITRRYLDNQALWKEQRERLYRVNAASELRRNAVNSLAILGAAGFVGWGALQGHHTPGDILLVLMLAQTLMNTVTPITTLINQAGEVEANAERLLTLINIESPVLDRPDAIALECIESVAFDDVTFTYPGTRASPSRSPPVAHWRWWGRAVPARPPSSSC